MRRKLKMLLGPLIVLITLVAFGWYLNKNPEVIEQLKQVPLLAVAGLVLLYGGILITLVIIMHAQLQLYEKRMSAQENFLLTSYSSLINFFGPGQSGPGFRAVYLKVRHGVKFKQYVFATLIYYAFYAVFSGMLLFAGSRPWWQTMLLLAAIIFCCYLVILQFMKRNSSMLNTSLTRSVFWRIGLVIGMTSLVQVLLTCAVYYTELRSLDSSITFAQAVTYTGAANFALFVALTPGAIGIREAFLLFSQQLHNISNDLIVAANVLDRAVYVLFLAILFVLVLVLHAGSKLQVKKVQEAAARADEQ